MSKVHGVMRLRRFGTLAGVCGLLWLASIAQVPAGGFSLGELLAALAANTHGSTSFTEKKYLSMLDIPVESSGVLIVSPPARFEQRTLKPKPETLVLDGDRVIIERQSRRHELQLKEHPELAGMMLGISATLAGDRDALERTYHVELDGSRDRWTLKLRPRDGRLALRLAGIVIDGIGDRVRRVEIRQADGDRSVMTIGERTGP